MRAAKRPELLICRELTRPLEFATMGLRHLRDELTEVPGPLCTEGLFVLVMARCDAMLQDSLRCYLRGVPGKIPFERERKEIRREDAVSTDLPARLADRYVQQWGYKATAIMVRTYCHLLSVNEVTQGTLEAIVYAKDKRNRILHDAPPEPWLPGTLASHGVRIDDVRKAADAVEALTGELKQAIEAKYGSYTRAAALQRLWAYLFHSPVMPFDKFWSIEDSGDFTRYVAGEAEECILSSSELMFVGVLKAHFNGGQTTPHQPVQMFMLDETHRDRMLYLLSTLSDFRIG